MAQHYYQNGKSYFIEIPLTYGGSISCPIGKYVKGDNSGDFGRSATNGILTDLGTGEPSPVSANPTLLVFSESILGPFVSTGDTGPQGIKGDTGASGGGSGVGSHGDTGATGAKGDTGTAGTHGDTGSGTHGDTGSGTHGDTGTAGTPGDTGTAGTPGDTGAGLKGDTGSGGQGDTGTAGVKGDTGSAGAALTVEPMTGAHALVAGDIGKLITITTGGITVPPTTFAPGDIFSIYNESGGSQTIGQDSGVTMYLAGTATTGDRTLAQRGMCTIICTVGDAEFVISGMGLT